VIDMVSDGLLPLIIGLLSGVVMFFFGYRSHSKADKAKRFEQRLKDMKTAEEVRDEVGALDNNGLADRASKWVSKKP